MRAAETMAALAALGEKKAGTPANSQARDLLRDTMREALGEDCAIADEAFPITVCPSTRAVIQTAEQGLAGLLLDYTGTVGGQVRGRLLSLGGGSALAFRTRDVRGAVVACKPSLTNHRVLLAERARNAGAVGILLVSRHSDQPVRGIGWPEHGGDYALPMVSVTGESWQRLRPSVGTEIALSWEFSRTEAQGTNLVCDLGGKQSARPLVIGAHFDSWGSGAQDNCAGAGLLVSLAAKLKKAGLHRDVRCVFFDAEELGMLGSRWHVSHNATETYRAYLNLEMPVPVRGTWLRTFFFSLRLPFRAVPFASLLRHGYLPIPVEWFYRAGNAAFPADIDPFHHAGVPSATTFCAGTHSHTGGDTCDRVRAACFPAIEAALFRMAARLQEVRCR